MARRRTPSRNATAYVVGAYVPAGGGFMAYQLARILHLNLGHPVTVITTGRESPDDGIFAYDIRFPSIPECAMEGAIAQDDILVCNPKFSDGLLGDRLGCFKLMYIQGFTTFKLLDMWFDHYVSVSGFVQDFVQSTYALETTVIPPFIIGDDSTSIAWDLRPANSFVIGLKGKSDGPRRLLARLRGVVRERAPEVEAGIDWEGSVLLDSGADKIPQTELFSRLGRARYFLTLSVAEGFGLVPLEAMARGAVVLGFDGYGGREYMQPGVNCAVRPYPDIEGVADDLIAAVKTPGSVAGMGRAGQLTAAQFNYRRFRTAWVEEFSRAFGV